MKLLFFIILFPFLFLACSNKDGYIFSSDVEAVTRRLFPVKSDINVQANGNQNNDTTKVADLLKVLLSWVNSSDFSLEYEYYHSTKSYKKIDSKIDGIIRNYGFSSLKEFELYLSANIQSLTIKELNDSLKATVRDRINKINKEISKKNN
jgi:hypothetical protein